ncbi:efflux RND transporter periplasmic adaptor subunit [Metallumcola ferriviriculae]|uniref:Efflux RND transporter periplasmic adaptor subunit n=1 Tax=Metallumcola ferriviriculae TaxID=3039180 RepID=A0AAU0ULL4_9FIRM|nr:efflux RND transporter periplasmic adaptor subunit [Desulfitibacteraceae bacterium MK1]
MMQRLGMILVIVTVVLGGGYYAYRQLVPPPAEEAQGPVYATEKVVRGDIAVGVDATGTLNPSNGGGIQVPGGYGPRTSGVSSYIVDEVLAKEGDNVKKDQLLVKLSSPELETKIENMEKQLKSDKKALAEQFNIPVSELSQINPAQGITLRAPISGRVIGLEVSEGEEMLAGSIVAKVVDDSRFKVTASLTPGEFETVKKGQQAVLRFSEFGGLIEAKVTNVNSSAAPIQRSQLKDAQYAGDGDGKEQYQLIYRVTLEGKNPGLVRPGMLVQVGLLTTALAVGEEPDATQANWLRYYAEVKGYVDEESVLSTAEAIATKIYVDEMETVEEGAPLVSLSGEDARQQIREDLDEIQQQEMDLQQLYAQFEQMEVRAPMDGIVARIESEPGQTIEPGRWLGHIYTTSDMQMWVQVDDVDVLLVKQDAPVTVTVAALPNKTFEGKVTHVSTMGSDQNGIPRFQVGVQVTGSAELRPGMQAQAFIDAGSAEDVLMVPLEAIFEEDSQSKVEVLQDNGMPKVVKVEIGLMNDRNAEIKSGLEEGQLVVTGSTADLLPSQHIQSQDGLLPSNGDGGGEEPANGGDNGGGSQPAPAKGE